jgi:flagellar biosynthesis anti-sigma factor FlgM
MRIDDLNRPGQTQAAERTERAGEQDKNERSARSSSDQVDISQLANALNSADTHRIEQLRLQVSAGTYQVQPDVVAKSIIDEHVKR